MIRRAVAFVAFLLIAAPVAGQDVCTGVSASLRKQGRMVSAAPSPAPAPAAGRAAAAAAAASTIGAARGATQTLPVPDITDWQPRTRVPMGGELIVQGRNLIPGKLVAMLGGDVLTPTTQSVSEIRFRVPDQTPGSPLVVFHTGGQPLTLETAYQVFDATVAIGRVVPTSFSTGDMVTVCGTNLFQVVLLDAYKDAFDNQVSPAQAGSFIEIGGKFYPTYFATTLSIQAFDPTVSPSGDRITFRVGKSFLPGLQQGGGGYLFPTGGSEFATPATASGTLLLRYKGASAQNRVIGPVVTWSSGGPSVTAAYTRWSDGVKAPWFIIPTVNTNALPGGQITAEGTNLTGAAWRIGSTTVNGVTVTHDNIPENGTYALVSVPANAVSGPVCATGNGKTSCMASPMVIFGGPVITRAPASPLPRLVNLTIEGLNLLPPSNASGLTYKFVAAFLSADYLGGNNRECNRVMQVIEHTANRIVFRIGDPAITTPPPAQLPSGRPLVCAGTAATGINIEASYQGKLIMMLKDLGLQFKQ
jgi:hypothetical protein